MNEKNSQETALFRFALIAPLVNNTHGGSSKVSYFESMSNKEHRLPDGKTIRISSSTIKKWYMKYLKLGFDGLVPKIRKDKNKTRAMPLRAMTQVHELKEKFPYITGKLIYLKLIEGGYIKAVDTSLSTVLRYIKNNNLKTSQLIPIERRAFEMEFSNDCWQSDTSHGPIITVDGKKVKTYLISFIDDASRLIVHADFFFNDNAINMQLVFRKAISKYGVPKKIYVDNGSSYRNEQLNLICANLGVILIHTPPYSPESKGKVERSFRTIKENWINGLDWNNYKDLLGLNMDLAIYLNDKYNNAIHSTIKQTPKERYLKDTEVIKFLPDEQISNSFLHRVTRKVNNDATIRIKCLTFEVSQKYIGQKINVRYSAENLEEAYIFDELKKVETIYQLRRVDNSKIKRNVTDYYDL